MLESGAPLEQVLPRLKHAATAAQQEARFAVLALSSAGGSARFDSALRRYVDVLAADGALDVELERRPPRQARARTSRSRSSGSSRRGSATPAGMRPRPASRSRSHSEPDDVSSPWPTTESDSTKPPRSSGQGVENMRVRARAIEGELTLRSHPGRGRRSRSSCARPELGACTEFYGESGQSLYNCAVAGGLPADRRVEQANRGQPGALRAWERRYGLFRPDRSPGRFRLYSDEDALRVQTMREHLAAGPLGRGGGAGRRRRAGSRRLAGPHAVRGTAVEGPLRELTRRSQRSTKREPRRRSTVSSEP